MNKIVYEWNGEMNGDVLETQRVEIGNSLKYDFYLDIYKTKIEKGGLVNLKI